MEYISILDYSTNTIDIITNTTNIEIEDYEDFLEKEGYNLDTISFMISTDLSIKHKINK